MAGMKKAYVKVRDFFQGRRYTGGEIRYRLDSDVEVTDPDNASNGLATSPAEPRSRTGSDGQQLPGDIFESLHSEDEIEAARLLDERLESLDTTISDRVKLRARRRTNASVVKPPLPPKPVRGQTAPARMSQILQFSSEDSDSDTAVDDIETNLENSEARLRDQEKHTASESVQFLASLPKYNPHVHLERMSSKSGGQTPSPRGDITTEVEESEDLLAGHHIEVSIDSGQNASVTTVCSSGRGDDSGADVALLPHKDLSELDQPVPSTSQGPSHGPMCSCIMCYTILNVDGGNDTSDTEEDINNDIASLATERNRLPRGSLPRDRPVDGSYDSLLRLTSSIDPGWFGLHDAEAKDKAEAQRKALCENQPSSSNSQADLPSQNMTQSQASTSGSRGRGRGRGRRRGRSTGPRYISPAKNSKRNERFRKRLLPCVDVLDDHKKAKTTRAASVPSEPRLLDPAGEGLVSVMTRSARAAASAKEAATARVVSVSATSTSAEASDCNAAASSSIRANTSRYMYDPAPRVTVIEETQDPEEPPRLHRVHSFASMSSVDSADSTDYSDSEDIRNFFIDSADDLEAARNHPILGKDIADRPTRARRNADDTMSEPRDSEDEQAQFGGPITAQRKQLLWVDRGAAENIPANVSHILHFPDRGMVGVEPQKILENLLSEGAKHHVPIVFLAKQWRRDCDIIEYYTGQRPAGFYGLRQKVLDDLPGCTLHYALENKATGQIRYVEGRSFKKSLYPASKYRPHICETRANLADLMKYHASLHKGERGEKLTEAVLERHEIPLHFYVDGVSPSTTGSLKMICEVVRHPCCNLLLNYNTIVYAKDYDITADDLLQGLLQDLNRNPNLVVKLVICDMPERLRLCGLTSHNGEHGCLTCFSPGEKRDGAPGVCWPASTMGAPLRDDENFRIMASATRDTGCVVGGQKTSSPLLNIPGFSIVDCVAVDPMHLVSGLTKYYWEKFGEKFLTKAEMKQLTDDMSKVYCGLDYPSDFKRSPRAMDTPKWRCNEWKQFLALVGIDLAEAYQKLGKQDVAEFWLRLTWIIRTMAQGDAWYRQASHKGKLIRREVEVLYRQVEKLLGRNYCTPNLHALYHLPEYRAKHPLGVLSTERAESFYGVNRRSFAEQSTSIGKQIHYNTLLAAKEGHACETQFKFQPYSKSAPMDHVMVDNTRSVYCYLRDAIASDCYVVKKVHCMPYNGLLNIFPWRDAGVMRVTGISEQMQLIEKRSVIARAIITKDKILYTWTRDLQDF